MSQMKVRYLGDLHTECTHLDSGAVIHTDAPKDNHGLGQAFSPTDLVATSLAACACSIIGIYGKQHDVDVTGIEVDVTKVMSANPRRIAKVELVFNMPPKNYSDKEKAMIERATHTCPVHHSLHPETEQVFTFIWN